MPRKSRWENAEDYDAWYLNEPGRSAAILEKRLLLQVWSPGTRQRVLEVGCGTGYFLQWFAEQGHMVTGLDSSRPMLAVAQRRLPPKIQLDHGHAEDLPYEENSFDTVTFITSLEFMKYPLQALLEACRVARSHVLLGVLNKYSLIALQRYWEQLWHDTTYKQARFFSVFELKKMARMALSGNIPIQYGTCLSLPLGVLPYIQFIEKSKLLTSHPFGHFIAMRIDLQYPIQTAQNPVFSKIPSGAQEISTCSPCRHATGTQPPVSSMLTTAPPKPPKPPSAQKGMYT